MVEIEFLGPPLDSGPFPAVFYFALSAQDSLYLDPYNQPALLLASDQLRVFSLTLPGHDIFPPNEALSFWAKKVAQGHDIVDRFVDQSAFQIQKMLDQNVLLPGKIGVMGLSRGVLIAGHIAARFDSKVVPYILGFAPLIKMDSTVEFHGLDVERWSLMRLAKQLCTRKVRCYIGNHDTRVGTHNTCEFITQLAAEAYHQRISSSPIELIIGPSIGHKGHGTSPEVFKSGATWMSKQLL